MLIHTLTLKFILWTFIVTSSAFVCAEENFLIVNGSTNEIIFEMGPNIHKQMSPCSTFKIPLSLMGYDAEILKNDLNPKWDYQEGYDNWLELWTTPQTPLSWIKFSCVWYSKVLSFKLGMNKIQCYLSSFKYGNHNISAGLVDPGPLTPFWINSSLVISTKEQVDFITKMILYQLPVSVFAVQSTKALLFTEELPDGYKLFGKTGWSGSNSENHDKTFEHCWFIGWIENEYNFYPFAYLELKEKVNLGQRIPRVKQLLEESILINLASYP